MTGLLRWLEDSDAPALITSCVFHYEFEFIHPFADGNGRLGRLWQSVFTDIPVESLIHQHQPAYYQALRDSTARSDCAPFIEFMLGIITATLQETLANESATTPCFPWPKKRWLLADVRTQVKLPPSYNASYN